jgi:uncharacterized protein YacL
MSNECTSPNCNIAVIFICGLIYTTFMIDKCTISKSFINTLSEEQAILYKKIMHERNMIYFGGVVFGLVISYLYMKIVPTQTTKINTVCTVISITFLSAYFFYIFYPKKDSIILELDNRTQREEWHAIYKKMQYHYHIGLAIGVIFILFFN